MARDRQLKFTESNVKTLAGPMPDGPERIEWRDSNCPGLVVRVTRNGNRSYALRSGSHPIQTLGRVGSITLEDARKLARDAAYILIGGGDPKADAIKVAEALSTYRRLHVDARKLRGGAQTLADLKRYLGPYIDRRLKDLRARDFDLIIDTLMRDGKSAAANRAFALLRGFLSFCEMRGFIQENPLRGRRLPAHTRSRARVLTDAELADVWQATDRLGPFNILTRLLLWTGCRRSEVAVSRWTDWSLDDKPVLTIVEGRAKNRRARRVPIPAQAAEMLKLWQTHTEGRRSPFLFPSAASPSRPMSGYSKGLRGVHKRSGTEGWHWHDCRRTVASGLLNHLEASPVLIQSILGHSTGAVGGVLAIYVRPDLEPQARAVMQRWANRLDALTADNSAVLD
jgi:integrase